MRVITRQWFRENRVSLILVVVVVLCLGLAGALYFGHLSFPRLTLAQSRGLDGPDIDLLQQQDKAYERIAEAVTPAIVAIMSTHIVKVQESPFFTDPFFRQFFGDLFPQIPRTQRERALGSGVIVSQDGYIVTNNHVIAKANEIQVMLSDKRVFRGKVVGADPQTDIGVVKIEAKNLPTVPFGDSGQLRVGHTVMAFGNPFGQFFTVTRGIVSAVSRSGLGIERGGFEDFIQTDAAINPGNSGGALVNIRGQVVGINTAILSGSPGGNGGGGSVGIGFAIPSNMASHVMADLIKTGKVSRGYLGIQVQSLTGTYAQEFKVPDTAGALIQDVTPGGPAAKGGLKPGDVIRRYNGQSVASADQLTAMVTNTSPGTEVKLDLLRDGKPMTITVTVGERPANLGLNAGRGAPLTEGALRGISVQNLTPEIRDRLGLPVDVAGVVISDLDPRSPAAQAGLQAGDVIESINRRPVHTVQDFARWAAEARTRTLLRINRQGAGTFVMLSPNEDGNND